MSKHLKDLLICLLSITILVLGCVGLYYGYKEYRRKEHFEQFWYNYFLNNTIHNTKNPYMVDDFIYKYGVVDEIAEESDASYPYCKYEVYTVKPAYQNRDDLQRYLNFYNEDSKAKSYFENNPNSLVMLDFEDNATITQWILNKQISWDMFHHIDELVYQENPKAKLTKDIIPMCLAFWEDSELLMKNYYSLLPYEHYKYYQQGKFDREQISKILNNPETLVKVDVYGKIGYSIGGSIYFYDDKYFIELSFKFFH